MFLVLTLHIYPPLSLLNLNVGGPTQPMFLYIAYTAAHSPLQPLPRHAAHCTHIPHSRRRDFCGLVVGLDEALQNLTASVEQHLGTNTIMIVASDNGGAAFFGGE